MRMHLQRVRERSLSQSQQKKSQWVMGLLNGLRSSTNSGLLKRMTPLCGEHRWFITQTSLSKSQTLMM